MNYIIMDKSCISAFSDRINADDHKHWMLQLFYAFDDDLLINITDHEIRCKCIVINSDVVHSFTTQNKPHFTMLIDLASPLALNLQNKYLQYKKYYVFDNDIFIDTQLDSFPQQPISILRYEHFLSVLFHVMGININMFTVYDERIFEVIRQLEVCDCTEHSIKEIAKNVALSPSRLSHLFKEQTGMPLKSYILLHMVQRSYLSLLQTGNVTRAALEAGFDSPSHFAAASKRLTGMSATDISKDSVFLKASYI